MNKILTIGLLISFSAYIMVENNVSIIGTLYFYILTFLLIVDLTIYKRITLLTVWNISYLFIINSEIFHAEFLINNYTLQAVTYLTIANNLINLGFLTYGKSSFKKKLPHSEKQNSNSKFTGYFLIGLLFLYVITTLPSALLAFSIGRISAWEQTNENLLLDSSMSALGFILPSIFAYYYSYILKKKIWTSLVFSLPIFIILFLGGTRFPLLFSLLGFTIVTQAKNKFKFKFKNYIQIIAVISILLLASDSMKSVRKSANSSDTELRAYNIKSENFTTLLNRQLSPEGVIDMTGLMFQHFETKPHLMGTSSSFIFYYWVPRTVWKEKPTMLGYWFIRKYRAGFGDMHSASFGFTGELFADFGLFSLFIIFLLGRLLKIADNYKNLSFQSRGFEIVLAAMIFPYVFFFVRSPITSSINFIGILFFYFVFKKIMFKKV